MVILLVVSNIISGGLDFTKQRLMTDLLMLPGMLIGLSFHEFGHAFVSYKLGDPTPERQGRVTLNPLAHIDPIGLIALIFAGFGWGKPVEIDPRYYDHRRSGEMMVAFAGVTMNLIMAFAFTFLIKLLLAINPLMFNSFVGNVILMIFQYTIYINLVLMVFNLLPIPPLDGFGIITEIFNLRKYSWYYPFYKNGFIILMILIFFNGTRFILGPAVQALYRLMLNIIMM